MHGAGEGGLVAEAAAQGDLGNRQVAVAQPALRLLDPYAGQPALRGAVMQLAKALMQLAEAHARDMGHAFVAPGGGWLGVYLGNQAVEAGVRLHRQGGQRRQQQGRQVRCSGRQLVTADELGIFDQAPGGGGDRYMNALRQRLQRKALQCSRCTVEYQKPAVCVGLLCMHRTGCDQRGTRVVDQAAAAFHFDVHPPADGQHHLRVIMLVMRALGRITANFKVQSQMATPGCSTSMSECVQGSASVVRREVLVHA